MDTDKRRWQTALAILFFGGCLAHGQQERLLSKTENAYNPIPSPDGKFIAYVRTGWGRPGGSGGAGRSNLRSEIALMDRNGRVLTVEPLADGFLSSWTPDGSSLVCYRDWRYWRTSLDGKRQSEGTIPGQRIERVTYLKDSFLWTEPVWLGKKLRTALVTPEGPIGEALDDFGADMPVASPDGRYVAVVGGTPESVPMAGGTLLVYDLQTRTWSRLGTVVIHPSEDWDYIKPSWNPWFADSRHLAYTSESALIVSTPDGSEKREILKLDKPHGLAVPSPDGKMVAFATFESRPWQARPDLTFWGGSTIWIAPIGANSTAKAVTQKNSDTTYGLRWLDTRAIVFDRIADVVKYVEFKNHRLWKAKLPD